MARIIYALSGQGRGHTSRVIAISDELRRLGHEVLFCGGGTAREILESQGEHILAVPSLRQVIEGNELQFFRTVACNRRTIFDLPNIIARLADEFSSFRPHLLITDFEAFSPMAARRIGLPVLSFNHQQVVTETHYSLPVRYWWNAFLTSTAIRLIVPRDPVKVLITSFFYSVIKNPRRTTLIPPIIRTAVQELQPVRGDHVLVYFNHPEGVEYLLDVLREVDIPFILYNFPTPDHPENYSNVQFKTPSIEGFLEDLATSRAVISTAGFTLTSEALYLGKPQLVAPNYGIFEQTLNALFLQREGLGSAVIGRPIGVEDIKKFLAQRVTYEGRLHGRNACGNSDAIACIENVLSTIEPTIHLRPALASEEVAQISESFSNNKPE